MFQYRGHWPSTITALLLWAKGVQIIYQKETSTKVLRSSFQVISGIHHILYIFQKLPTLDRADLWKQTMLLAQHANKPTKPLKYGVLETFCPRRALILSNAGSQNRTFRFTFPPISLASSSISSAAPNRCSNSTPVEQQLLGEVWW